MIERSQKEFDIKGTCNGSNLNCIILTTTTGFSQIPSNAKKRSIKAVSCNEEITGSVFEKNGFPYKIIGRAKRALTH